MLARLSAECSDYGLALANLSAVPVCHGNPAIGTWPIEIFGQPPAVEQTADAAPVVLGARSLAEL